MIFCSLLVANRSSSPRCWVAVLIPQCIMGNGDQDKRDTANHRPPSGGGRAKSPADCNSNHVSSGSRVIMPVPKLKHERRHSHSPSTSAAAASAASILDLSSRYAQLNRRKNMRIAILIQYNLSFKATPGEFRIGGILVWLVVKGTVNL